MQDPEEDVYFANRLQFSAQNRKPVSCVDSLRNVRNNREIIYAFIHQKLIICMSLKADIASREL